MAHNRASTDFWPSKVGKKLGTVRLEIKIPLVTHSLAHLNKLNVIINVYKIGILAQFVRRKKHYVGLSHL